MNKSAIRGAHFPFRNTYGFAVYIISIENIDIKTGQSNAPALLSEVKVS